MQYAVKILQDDDLPEDRDWCIITTDTHIYACVKASRATSPQILADAWLAARHAESALEPDWSQLLLV